MLNVNITNDDLTDVSLSTFEPRERASIEAAVLLIAAKEVIASYEPLYGEMLSVQAHHLLGPLRKRKHDEALAAQARLKDEVDGIANDIQKFTIEGSKKP
jgi:hypothetical protein